MKKAMLQFLAGVLLLGSGAVVVVVADSRGWLPGMPKSSTSGVASECPHSLTVSTCPFCNASLIEELGFCKGHGVPEAFCSRCNPALIPAFKAVNDWCGGHGVPESQCTLCHPELLSEKPGPDSPPLPAREDILVTSVPRAQRAPLVTCDTEALVVQFQFPDVARAAGLEYAAVRRQEVSQTLSGNVQLAYAADRYGRLSSRVSGVVTAVHGSLGQRVAEGELLAVVDSPELGRARADWRRERREIEAARVLRDRTRTWYDRVNDLEIRLTASRYLEARNLLDMASRNYEREQRLQEQGISSERRLLEAGAELVKARNGTDTLRRSLRLFGIDETTLDALSEAAVETLHGRGTTSEQSVIEATRELALAETRLQAARDRLQLFGLSATEIDAAGEELASTLPLRAPFDGVIVAVDTVHGEVVEAGQPLFALADTSMMWALIDVSEANAPQVAVGQPVVVDTGGRSGRRFGGRVTWISSAVDRHTRTLPVRAELDNADGLLRAGMFGNAEITVRDREPVLTVPHEAVQWEGCCNIVFIRENDVTFRPRKVHLGYETERFFLVEQGLQEGEQVVTTGSFLLKTEILKGSIGAGCCEIELGRN